MEEGINDLELQRLKKEKPEISPALVRQLREALDEFAASYRFGILETLGISHFFEGEETGVAELEGLSISELVELGAIEIACLSQVTDSFLSLLTSVVQKFMEGEDHPELAAPACLVRPVASSLQYEDVESNIPRYSSVEAEKKLNEAFTRVTQSNHFEAFQDQRVEKYWNSEVGQAPFIEALTFRELSGLSVDSLLKKKSFSNRKIHGLLIAVNACLTAFESQRTSNSEPVSRSEQQEPSHITKRWVPASQALPLHLQSFLNHVEFQAACLKDSHELGVLTSELIEDMAPEAFLALVLLADLGSDVKLVSSTLGISETKLETLKESAQEQLASLAGLHAPRLLKHWQPLLRTAAVAEEQLFENQYVSGSLDRSLQTLMLRILLLAIGAARSEVSGYVFEYSWTTNPEAMELLFANILKNLPKEDQVLRKEVEAYLPFVPIEQFFEALSPHAVLDEDGQTWRLLEGRTKKGKKSWFS